MYVLDGKKLVVAACGKEKPMFYIGQEIMFDNSHDRAYGLIIKDGPSKWPGIIYALFEDRNVPVACGLCFCKPYHEEEDSA